MVRLGSVLLLLAVLTGCGSRAAPTPEAAGGNQGPTAAQPASFVEPAPIPEPVVAVTTTLTDVAEAVVDVMPTPAAPAAPPAIIVSPAAVELIVAQEVISQRYYERRLLRPVWPGGASGVTVGIGADMGYSSPRTIRSDWVEHPQVERLALSAGVSGQRAKALTAQMQDVLTPFSLALDVFESTHLVEFYNLTRRTYPGFDDLPLNAQGALVSLTFNRGSSMTGERRREMKEIRDTCVPNKDTACIAAQLRAMKRVWKGSDIERGMANRRDAEAVLATLP